MGEAPNKPRPDAPKRESRSGEPKRNGDRDRDERGGSRNRGPRGDSRPRRDGGGSGVLRAGLFESIGDKQVPCRVDGCTNTWTWFGAQQLRSLGEPIPQRMCDEHLGQFNELSDRQIECRNPGCANTWLWKRGAQLHLIQRGGELKTPSRLCTECFEVQRNLADKQMPCKVSSCKRSWIWTADAQRRHQAWLLRQQAKPDNEAGTGSERAAPKVEQDLVAAAETGSAPLDAVTQAGAAAPEGGDAQGKTAAAPGEGSVEASGGAGSSEETRRSKRKRKRKRKISDGPPEKMCSLCAARAAKTTAIELPCKVHGCTRTFEWDRASQLRGWAAMGTESLEAQPTVAKRMCSTCREFCRVHPDREIKCGRPECNTTWTHKTGAQLQAFLAGRTEDPIKLCDDCAKGQFPALAAERAASSQASASHAGEIMPCVVAGCSGRWIYVPGMKLSAADDGQQPVDRMCDPCRVERGESPRVADVSPGQDLAEAVASSPGSEELGPPRAAESAPESPEDAEADGTSPPRRDSGSEAPTEEVGPEAAEASPSAVDNT